LGGQNVAFGNQAGVFVSGNVSQEINIVKAGVTVPVFDPYTMTFPFLDPYASSSTRSTGKDRWPDARLLNPKAAAQESVLRKAYLIYISLSGDCSAHVCGSISNRRLAAQW
jgi:hypothetical protein